MQQFSSRKRTSGLTPLVYTTAESAWSSKCSSSTSTPARLLQRAVNGLGRLLRHADVILNRFRFRHYAFAWKLSCVTRAYFDVSGLLQSSPKSAKEAPPSFLCKVQIRGISITVSCETGQSTAKRCGKWSESICFAAMGGHYRLRHLWTASMMWQS